MVSSANVCPSAPVAAACASVTVAVGSLPRQNVWSERSASAPGSATVTPAAVPSIAAAVRSASWPGAIASDVAVGLTAVASPSPPTATCGAFAPASR